MTYTVTKTDGTVYSSIGEGVVDNTLGISLIGQSFSNYGQLIANNFVYLLENQASDAQPANPIEGQLWWNTETKVLSVFDGNRFKPTVSSAVSDSIPLSPIAGDQWWDKNESRLKIYTGAEWVVIGPTYTKNQGFGGWNPNSVTDTNGNSRVILELTSNGEIVAVINNGTSFQLASAINNISTVGKGMTFAPSMSVTSSVFNAPVSPVTFQLAGTTSHVFYAGAVYTTTATGETTWAVTGLPVSGTVATWTVEITNGVSGTQTWYSGTKWTGGVPPVLTAGTDILRFYTYNGGATIRGLLEATNSS